MDTTFIVIIALIVFGTLIPWPLYEEFRKKRAREKSKPETYTLT